MLCQRGDPDYASLQKNLWESGLTPVMRAPGKNYCQDRESLGRRKLKGASARSVELIDELVSMATGKSWGEKISTEKTSRW